MADQNPALTECQYAMRDVNEVRVLRHGGPEGRWYGYVEDRRGVQVAIAYGPTARWVFDALQERGT